MTLIALTVNDWTMLPDDPHSLIRNPGTHRMWIVSSPTKPVTTVGAFELNGKEDTARIGEDTHWVYSQATGRSVEYSGWDDPVTYTYRLVQVLTQDMIDNGITLEATTSAIADSVLTVDELDGEKLTPTTDYTVSTLLLEFSAGRQAELTVGDTIRFVWD